MAAFACVPLVLFPIAPAGLHGYPQQPLDDEMKDEVDITVYAPVPGSSVLEPWTLIQFEVD